MNDSEIAKNQGRSEAGLKEHRQQSKRRSKVKTLIMKYVKDKHPTVFYKAKAAAEKELDGKG